MPIANVRIQPPTYNSDKDTPPFAEYHDMFLNFVDYQDGGRSLITLAMNALGRNFNTSIGFTRDDMDGSLLLGHEELDALETRLDALSLETGAARVITQYGHLTDEEKMLDRDLYSILSQCITGKHRVVIANVQFRSFVQGWVRLVSCMGANNIQRKTELITNLQKLTFDGDISIFKTQVTKTIKDL